MIYKESKKKKFLNVPKNIYKKKEKYIKNMKTPQKKSLTCTNDYKKNKKNDFKKNQNFIF